MESFTEAWNLICDFCKNRITEVAFTTWISRIEPVTLDFNQGTAILKVPNDFHRQTLERCYTPLLTEALDEVSVYASQFDDFTYSAEDKGHVYNNASDMGGVGSVVGDVSGKLIIKIRDGKLAAVLQEASLDASVSGMTMTGSAGMGMVYTVGGQSITLPTV